MSDKFKYNFNAQPFIPKKFVIETENEEDLDVQNVYNQGEFYYGEAFEDVPQGAFIQDDVDIFSGAVMFDQPEGYFFDECDDENMNQFFSQMDSGNSFVPHFEDSSTKSHLKKENTKNLSTEKVEQESSNVVKLKKILSENVKTENLQKIRKEILDLPVLNDKDIQEIVDFVVTTSVSKSQGSYCDLCQEILIHAKDQKKFNLFFFQKIQNEYESEFEKFSKDKSGKKMEMKKILTFIGEMWIRKIVPNKVMVSIIDSILKEMDLIFPFFTKFGQKLIKDMPSEMNSLFDRLDIHAKEKTTSNEDKKSIQKLKLLKQKNFERK